MSHSGWTSDVVSAGRLGSPLILLDLARSPGVYPFVHEQLYSVTLKPTKQRVKTPLSTDYVSRFRLRLLPRFSTTTFLHPRGIGRVTVSGRSLPIYLFYDTHKSQSRFSGVFTPLPGHGVTYRHSLNSSRGRLLEVLDSERFLRDSNDSIFYRFDSDLEPENRGQRLGGPSGWDSVNLSLWLLLTLVPDRVGVLGLSPVPCHDTFAVSTETRVPRRRVDSSTPSVTLRRPRVRYGGHGWTLFRK